MRARTMKKRKGRGQKKFKRERSKCSGGKGGFQDPPYGVLCCPVEVNGKYGFPLCGEVRGAGENGVNR